MKGARNRRPALVAIVAMVCECELFHPGAKESAATVWAAGARRVAAPGMKGAMRMMGEAMLKNTLLACGAIASLVYIAADLAAAYVYPGYHSFTAQAVSELTAVGAPTRALVKPMFIGYDLLVMAFAVGLWMSGHDDRLRVTAAFVGAIGLVGLAAAPFADMTVRAGALAGNDVLHLAITAVIVLCVFGGVMFSAAALGRGFFAYSVATLVILAAFGAWAGLQGVQLAAGGPTPWLGAVERIHIGTYLLWMAALSFAVRRGVTARHRGARSRREPSRDQATRDDVVLRVDASGGCYPARKAVSLNPVDTLRDE